MPSSLLLHMCVVTVVQFTLACGICWYSTFRLLLGLSGGSRSSIANRWRSIRKLLRSQVLSVIAGLGYSIGMPLQCVQMISMDIAYDRARRDDSGKSDLVDHIDWELALGFGIPGSILVFGAGFVAIYINVQRLDLFDGTILEMREERKTGYRRLYLVTLGMVIVWLGWSSFSEPTPIAFAFYTGLCILLLQTLLCLLTFEFATRLSQFLDIAQMNDDDILGASVDPVSGSMHGQTPSNLRIHSNNSNPCSHTAGDSISINSRMTTETNLSEDDIYLLSVVIKQSLLSIIVLISLFITGIVMCLAILLTEGVLNAYTRVGVTQTSAVICLCGYLSYEFADRDYAKLCGGTHRWIEDYAVDAITPRTPRTPHSPDTA